MTLTADNDVLHLLVVSATVLRATHTRDAACGWPLAAHVEWVCAWHQAVRRARELPATLVIVDCSAGPSGVTEGRALVRHLLRHRPGVEVLAFVDADTDEPLQRAPGGAWPWPALPLVLDEWLDLRMKLRGASAQPCA